MPWRPPVPSREEELLHHDSGVVNVVVKCMGFSLMKAAHMVSCRFLSR